MFYRLVRGLFYLYFKCLYSWEFSGMENIPSGGSFIICANHTSWFDPPMLGCLLPGTKRIHFMAKQELFEIFIIGPMLKKLGAFPVKRDTADRSAIRRALQVLEEGGVLGLFPEGTRSRTGELGDLHNGAALISLRGKSPVLPVSIRWPGKCFKHVEVKVGPLISFAGKGKINKKLIETVSLQISEGLGELL